MSSRNSRNSSSRGNEAQTFPSSDPAHGSNQSLLTSAATIQAGSKAFYFVLEGLNAFATTFFFYYLFFFMAKEYGFGNKENLTLAALNGLVYTGGAWMGGKLGQRYGYLRALGVGIVTMAISLAAGGLLHGVKTHITVMIVCTVGMCLTWPNLQALVSDKEPPTALPRVVGFYNVVWATLGGVAFFTGGVLLETLGLLSLFWLPVAVQGIQLILLFWLMRRSTVESMARINVVPSASSRPALNPRPIARAKAFLRMAWFSNPFAYVAANTIVAVIPGLARKLELTPRMAGFFCSIWLFARLAMFVCLWFWGGWHYRFRWFVSAYVLLIASFAGMLLLPKLAFIIAAQIGFGIALGLIYYSSLYYSMDVGEARAEQGGFHEAAIGAGLFGGPAVGAIALYFFPDRSDSSAVAVSSVLVLGLVGLLVIRYRSQAALKPL
jgi:MFS family permease